MKKNLEWYGEYIYNNIIKSIIMLYVELLFVIFVCINVCRTFLEEVLLGRSAYFYYCCNDMNRYTTKHVGHLKCKKNMHLLSQWHEGGLQHNFQLWTPLKPK